MDGRRPVESEVRMVKISVRKAGAALLGAALMQGAAGCAPADRHGSDWTDGAGEAGFETAIASGSAAYSVPSPGEGMLSIEYVYAPSGSQKLFFVTGGSSDEFVRTGEKLTATIAGWMIGSLIQTDSGAVTPETVSGAKVQLAVTWMKGPAVLSTQAVKVASWKGDPTFGWPDAITDAFVVPAGATGMRAAIEATSPDGTKSARDAIGETPVFGGALPTKHLFYDLDTTGAARSRMIERGAPIAGAELVVAYAEPRADRLVDSGSIDRRIGRVKTYNPRFGTTEGDIFGQLVHVISVGWDVGNGYQEQALVASPSSYVHGGVSQETRLAIPAKATKLSMYFHVKTYVVASYPTYGEVTERKFADNQWVLVREKWDNPGGAGTNFAFGTDVPEPPADGVERTVVFIKGETQPGQDLFVRGGIDHDVSKKLRGVDCANADGTPNYACAIPIVHRNLRNPTSKPWKLGDSMLDWYGRESTQILSSGSAGLAQGTAADWTTNAWPASWGAQKTVAIDGYGVEPLNTVAPHLWMLDVDMDCSRAFKAADGTRWFEVKSFVTNGPGWEPDVKQAAAPYASPNHLAKCGQASYFERGSSTATFKRLP
jgi:hypothetical protein